MPAYSHKRIQSNKSSLVGKIIASLNQRRYYNHKPSTPLPVSYRFWHCYDLFATEERICLSVSGNIFHTQRFLSLLLAGETKVESIPLALFAASKIKELGFERMLQELVAVGGDTDTNCSIAGQIAGALIGKTAIPQKLQDKLMALAEYNWIRNVMDRFIQMKNWS